MMSALGKDEPSKATADDDNNNGKNKLRKGKFTGRQFLFALAALLFLAVAVWLNAATRTVNEPPLTNEM